MVRLGRHELFVLIPTGYNAPLGKVLHALELKLTLIPMNHSPTHGNFSGSTGLHGSVLIIENDRLVCEALDDILSASGMRVYTAYDGIEGEALYRRLQHDIDVIIIDWRLPRQDGADTLRKIKQLNPQVQVMVSSGYAEEDLIGQFDDLQPVTFLAKPFNIDKLLNQVKTLLA